VVEAVTERFPTIVIDGLEADDVMGILATTDRFIGESVVVTLDKDLRTVPGVHFNPLKDTKPLRVTDAQADYWWLTQALTGDTTDFYKGIPGCGPKKAEKILGPLHPKASPAILWPKVLAAYHAASLTESDALQQARVARILRRCDYDKSTKEVLLWHPTQPTRLSLLSLTARNLSTATAPTPDSVPEAAPAL
jgi:DNA polymerase-1